MYAFDLRVDWDKAFTDYIYNHLGGDALYEVWRYRGWTEEEIQPMKITEEKGVYEAPQKCTRCKACPETWNIDDFPVYQMWDDFRLCRRGVTNWYQWRVSIPHLIYAPQGGAAIRNRMLSAKLTRIAHQVSQERDLNAYMHPSRKFYLSNKLDGRLW